MASIGTTSRSHTSHPFHAPVGVHSKGPAAPQLGDLIAPQLVAVDQLFSRELASDLPNVNDLVTHVAKFRGKMLRPMLVLLSGLAAGGEKLGDEHITLATVVEMVHMATLVHDDILDGAEVRRKGATINHLHGNEAAVLLGDYLISHAYHLCSSLNSQAASRLIAHTTNIVCEGELTQNYNRRNWKLDEKTYYLIIYRKTAALTETCCRLGAMFATSRAAHVEALTAYGRLVGMAFQIVDDILDICGAQKTVGKSLGTDIEKGKLTLPLIHFLKHAAPQHRELLIELLESQEHDRIAHVRQLVAPSESIAFARNEAERLVREAVA
ncbi:MAG TPA: polyprenyl synthetase family protein, partial [Phycisphaerae bacterium]|nr:polyprenyl synthetase family protein [Phycisphaerae bacterium]